MFLRKKPLVHSRGVHLDLKGLQPSAGRLLELLEIAKEARFNLLLVEWEDSYPWTAYPELRSPECYSEEEVNRFLQKAKKISIEVIPLLQSFGHMENAASRKRFAHLREEKDDFSSLCPSREGSRAMLVNMIEDVMRTHRGFIGRFHLGADEVWNFASCPACKSAAREKGPRRLFLDHVLLLADYLSESGLTAIIWDDMLRGWTAGDLEKISGRLELAAWSYSEKGFESLMKKGVLARYKKAGLKVWGCPAFKGADGATADTADVDNRVGNHLDWLEAHKIYSLEGIITTGWSRYSTFRAPCESLEASIDSLVLAGGCLWDGKASSRQASHRFIRSGRLSELAGESFFNCLEASRAAAAWRKAAFSLLESIHALSIFAGEEGRVNPAEIRKARKRIDDFCSEGKKVFARWEAVHDGLVPQRLLASYGDSRIKPLKNVFDAAQLLLREAEKSAAPGSAGPLKNAVNPGRRLI